MFPIAYAHSLAYRKHPKREHKWFFSMVHHLALQIPYPRHMSNTLHRPTSFLSSYTTGPYNPASYQSHNPITSTHHATISNREHYVHVIIAKASFFHFFACKSFHLDSYLY